MRSVAVLAVGRHQQTFLAEREPVDGIQIHRVDVGHAMLFGQIIITVAVAAGARNVERIDRRTGVILGKDSVSIAVATGAGMLGAVSVYASDQPLRFAGMAVLTLYRRHLIRMRIILDGGVAIAALQAAMQTGAKDAGIHAYTMPCCVLQALVPVAGEAIRLRLCDARHRNNQKRPQGECNGGSSLHLGSDRSLRYQPLRLQTSLRRRRGRNGVRPSPLVYALRLELDLVRCYFCSVRMYATTSLICALVSLSL